MATNTAPSNQPTPGPSSTRRCRLCETNTVRSSKPCSSSQSFVRQHNLKAAPLHKRNCDRNDDGPFDPKTSCAGCTFAKALRDNLFGKSRSDLAELYEGENPTDINEFAILQPQVADRLTEDERHAINEILSRANDRSIKEEPSQGKDDGVYSEKKVNALPFKSVENV
ncbi:hypothetical protein M3Y95_00100800 [Aphelenchoides besseyi]|nr:hypothetical protein M3Y95_00100800 [Aphelenchoides besseyi]